MRFIAHTFSMERVRIYFVYKEPCSRFILNLESMYMLSCGFQNGGLNLTGMKLHDYGSSIYICYINLPIWKFSALGRYIFKTSSLAGLYMYMYMYMYMYNAYRPLNHDKDVYYTYVVWSHLGM